MLQFEEQAELKRLADDAIEARSDRGQGLWMREDFDDSSWESINNPEDANLCGKNGVLASPFRTDDYPISRETGVVTDFGPGA